MPRLPEFVQGTVGGVPSVFEDAEDELVLDRQLWAQVVSLLAANGTLAHKILHNSSISITGTIGSDSVNLTIS